MIEPTTCHGCGGPVQIRRPNRSGRSFCQAPKCQAAKQRWYRRARVDKAVEEAGSVVLRLVYDLAHVARTECPRCGLADGLPGWVHRDLRDPGQPCFGLGPNGNGLPSGALDAIHPELKP